METMRKQPQDFSLGQTASGGSQGMAALEGIVTAMEVRFCALLFYPIPARVFRISQVPPLCRSSYFQSFTTFICYDLTLIPSLIDVRDAQKLYRDPASTYILLCFVGHRSHTLESQQSQSHMPPDTSRMHTPGFCRSTPLEYVACSGLRYMGYVTGRIERGIAVPANFLLTLGAHKSHSARLTTAISC